VELDTGDLLFFHGNDASAMAIQAATVSHWCHIGMVIRLDSPTIDDGAATTTSSSSPRLALWESAYGTSGLRTLLDDSIRNGVQLVDLSARLRGYNRVFGCVKLRPHGPHLREHVRVKALECVRTLNGRPYEEHYGNLFWAWWHWVTNVDTREDTSSFFCSELVAETLSLCGVMQRPTSQCNHAASNFTVADFADATAFNEHYARTQDFTYDPLVWLQISGGGGGGGGNRGHDLSRHKNA
jgi:hypothetical protein